MTPSPLKQKMLDAGLSVKLSGSVTEIVEAIYPIIEKEIADLKTYSEGQAELLACYRLGKQPKESTWKKLEKKP